ncbi:MAG: hypothetical protein FJ134_15250 [Deltaproteobacteria bacterium]|nr:hypothetical protein [Deltaproteobacteria bacterium]
MFIIPCYFKRPVDLALTFAGLELHTRHGAAFIPWQDVSGIGLMLFAEDWCLGLILSSYDNFLNNMTPEVAQDLKGSAMVRRVLWRRLLRIGMYWPARKARRLWSRLARKRDLAAVLKGLGEVGDLAELLLISRESSGYDLLFTRFDLDRPTRKMEALMESYRRSSVVNPLGVRP